MQNQLFTTRLPLIINGQQRLIRSSAYRTLSAFASGPTTTRKSSPTPSFLRPTAFSANTDLRIHDAFAQTRRRIGNGNIISPAKEEALWAIEQAKARNMVETADTALIFHSWTTHRRYLTHLKEAFGVHPDAMHAIAVKTNPHPAILRQLVDWGFGLECASMEEVHLAMIAGCPGPRIVFDSPVKTRREIQICHENPDLHGILINVNSLAELERIPKNPHFVVGLRINPLVDTGAPEIFQVSRNESKFGTPIVDKDEILEAIVKYPVTQLHVHSGTAMADLNVAVGAIANVVDLALEANEMLVAKGITNRKIVGVDIGGGLRPETLGDGSSPSNMQYYANELQKAAPALFEPGMKLVTEFGQWTYFYSGFAYSQIEYALQREQTNVAYIHLGANMFLRDVYTGKRRGIEFVPIGDAADRPLTLTDIAGPLCFAGDYLQQHVMMPRFEEGDEILMLNTGSNAYGLWSRHCSRTTPKVIGVDRHSESLNVMSPRRNPHLEESYGGVLLPWEGPSETTSDDEDDAVASC